MTPQPLKSYIHQAWLGLSLLLIILLLTGFLLYQQERKSRFEGDRQQAETISELIETVTYNALHKGQYELIDVFLSRYFANNNDIAEIRLFAANGFTLSHHKRPLKSSTLYKLERSITYSYNGEATLLLTFDLAETDQVLEKFLIQLLATGIFLGVAFFYLINQTIRRRTEASVLHEQAQELNRVNQQLELEVGERKRAEENASNALAELAQIFESITDGMRLTDLDFNMLRVNKTFAKMCGIEQEEAVGMKCYDAFPGPRCQSDKCPIELIKSGTSHMEYETEKTKRDGSQVPCLVTASPFRDADGNLLGVVEDFRDITQRKRSEEELRHVQKMEAIGTLAGGIAHDFNNILYAIQGYTELTLLELPKGGQQEQNLLEIKNSTKRAADLVKQLLTFCRKNDQEKNLLNLEPVTKEALKFMRGSLPSTIDIKQRIEGNSGSVLADLSQIHQLIVCLCTNAADSMQESGGTLTVTLRQVTLEEKQAKFHSELHPGSYALLSISDTGPGIPQDVLPRIFDPYFTTKGLAKSSGLGLAIVHGIIRNHNGAIDVTSTSSGSKFDLYFPVQEAIQPAAAPPIPQLKLDEKGSRILLVDDEDVIVNFAQRALGKLGFTVSPFTDSNKALEAFTKDPTSFDVVMTDQTMPGLTGVELAKQILAIRPEMPIILATGFSETVSEEEAKDLGIKEYLLKPATIEDLQLAINRALKTTEPN